MDLYQLTVFETALFGSSTISQLFTSRESFEVLEYLGDLKHYYKTGYGFPINYRQAAPLLRDMVNIDAVFCGWRELLCRLAEKFIKHLFEI